LPAKKRVGMESARRSSEPALARNGYVSKQIVCHCPTWHASCCEVLA
jgi:hypothetical protein